MDEQFTQWVEFTAAFDRRHPDPKKNYGIHGVEMRCYLKGPLGVIQFVVYTNWQLPHVTAEFKRRPAQEDALWRPTPADIGYHSPVPRYENQKPMTDACPLLGGPCYYDGSSLQAEAVFKILVEGGGDALWREMERYYRETLAPEEVPA